jgi:hypothetical protein
MNSNVLDLKTIYQKWSNMALCLLCTEVILTLKDLRLFVIFAQKQAVRACLYPPVEVTN